MRRRQLLAAALLVALVAMAGCQQLPPRTEEVCDGCVSGVTETANETGRPVEVEDSVTHVYLQQSGAARFEARIVLSGPGVDEFRTNASLVGAVVERVESADRRGPGGYDDDRTPAGYGEYGGTRPAFERSDVTARMEGSDLVVTYRVDDFTERRFGTTLSDAFFRADGEGREEPRDYEEAWLVETDRLVVHGPDGTEPLVRPEGADVEGATLVWQGSVAPRTYVVFGEAGVARRFVGRAAIAADVYGWAGSSATATAALPTILLFVLTGLLTARYPGYVAENDGWDRASDGMFWALVGLSAAFVLGAAALLVSPPLGLLVWAGTLVATGVLWLRSRSDADRGSNADPDPDPDPRSDSGTGDDPEPEQTGDTGESADRDGPGERAAPDPSPGPGASTEADGVAGRRDADDASGRSETADAGRTGVSAAARSGFAGRIDWQSREPRTRALVAAAAVLAAAVAVTAVVAVDYRGTVAGLFALGAGAVPLVAFPALGYFVTVPERVGARVALLVGTVTAPWLVAFSHYVGEGVPGASPLLVIAWGFGAAFVGLVLFYAELWSATR